MFFLISFALYFINLTQRSCAISPGDQTLLDQIRSGNITELVIKVSRSCYYIKDGYKSTFPDRYTLNRMGYEYNKLNFVGRDFIAAIPDSPKPLQSLWDHHSNENFLKLGKSGFILHTEKVYSLLNPCYVYWNGNIVISWRTESEAFRLVHLDRSNNRQNSGILSAENIVSDIEFMKRFSFVDANVSHLSMKGEDPRLVVTRDSLESSKQRLYVVFCKRYHKSRPELQMSYAEVILKDGKLMTEAVLDINFNNERPREDQKNWSPFAVNGSELLFIGSIDPHRVVTTVPIPGQPSTKVHGKTVALTHPFPPNKQLWKYGELRGGSPAVLIPTGSGDRYLTFFHSSNHPPDSGPDVLKTYAMGAYTFCSTPPYRILSISSIPFVHDSMYTGPWSHLPESYYHIDYIVFPMSFVLTPEFKNGSTVNRFIYLTYGRRDSEGWVAKLDYNMLMSSLTVINENC